MNKHIKNALRLTWGEVSYYISGYVSRYLGRNIVCKATVEDGNYWDTSAVNTEFTKSEFRTLLSLVFADDFIIVIPLALKRLSLIKTKQCSLL